MVGYSMRRDSGDRAFRWTQADGMIDLGTLRTDNMGNSYAYGVNAAGSVVVGSAFYSGATAHAFRWTQDTGMTDLGTLTANNTGESMAKGINAIGDIVVGSAYSGTDHHAFRWTLDAGSSTQGTMTDLGTLRTGNTGRSSANAVNAAGDVVVGYASSETGFHAFRWTLTEGMTNLGTLHTDKITGYSDAYGVNAAGDVVVGSAYSESGQRAFRWTSTTGMQSIEDWLTANGVTVNASAPKTMEAKGVNAAGDVVVGQLDNFHAFIATTKGLLDQVENNRSLAGSSDTPARAMQDASLVMHGAHGSPMRGLRKNCVWRCWRLS